MVINKKSIKSQQKKAKTYQSNKIISLDNILEIDPSIYNFKYIARPDGTYTISKMSINKQWSIFNIEIDYKQLRAWQKDNKQINKGDTKKFDSKYKDIDFNI